MTTKLLEIAGSQIPISFGDPRQPKCLPLSDPKSRSAPFKTESVILPKGYIKKHGARPLPCDMLFEKDVEVRLRDGVRVWVDVLRPVPRGHGSGAGSEGGDGDGDGDGNVEVRGGGEKVPAIVAWSPYGKTGGGGCQALDDIPLRMGVRQSLLSELQKWEGPDPAYWVQYGYAVVNPDARGAGMSEGDICALGSQEGRDGADVVDWVGEQSWCNGKVGLSGNSWLAASQWYIAAEKPKHLAAIAPWEGFSDLFHEMGTLGGVLSQPILSFLLGILALNSGNNSWENFIEMILRYESEGIEGLEKYVEDKRARIENIDIPAYVVAAWSNNIHTYGTFRGFQQLTGEKWLRVHDTQEWPDYYSSESTTDLHRFFDYYLKGIQNNWPTTPRVRMKIIDTANPLPLTATNLSTPSFPPPDSAPLKLYFAQDGKLSLPYPPASSQTFSIKTNQLNFTHIFTEDTTLCSAVDIRLSISLKGMKDADVYVYIEKVLLGGGIGKQLVVPYPSAWQSWFIRSMSCLTSAVDGLFYRGPMGMVRVSRREIDTEQSLEGFPISRMDLRKEVGEGQRVVVRPCMLPIGMRFKKGEGIRVRVNGREERGLPDVGNLKLEGLVDLNEKGGEVTVYCGGSGDEEEGSWMEVRSV